MTLPDRSDGPNVPNDEDDVAPHHPAPDDKAPATATTTTTTARTTTPPPSSDDATPQCDPQKIIEMDTFSQILDLDEENNHDFSKGMAWDYFEQAATTFHDMDNAYAEQDLPRLSSLGHFLKGSSAALGITKVQASCERIQHYGALRDEELHTDLSRDAALEKIATLLERVKTEYSEAEKWLKDYYNGLE